MPPYGDEGHRLLSKIFNEHGLARIEGFDEIRPGDWIVKFTAYNTDPIWFVLAEKVGMAILKRPPNSYWEHIS